MQGKDFVIVGLQPWDIKIGSNCKNIAAQLAQQNRVLYVNRPLDRWTLLRYRSHERIKNYRATLGSPGDNLRQVQPNLWVLNPSVVLESINWIRWPAWYLYLNQRNARLITAQISLAIKRLGFGKIIVFNDNDFLNYFYLQELLSPTLYVYYIRDFLTSQPYFGTHGDLENKLMRKADIVLANSHYLRDYGASHNAQSFFVGQGCDFSLLEVEDLSEPKDIRSIAHPRIGYVGALLANRLDIAMLLYCVEALPHYHFVLVGPEDAAFAKSRLHKLPNVHFLGAKAVEEVPRYIRQLDVCINPQQVNAATTGNYPRKIDEYLGMGKPVVATATAAMNYFAKHVYLAQDKATFAALLTQAYNEDHAEARSQRQAFARTHTWEHSVTKIYQAINAFVSNQNLSDETPETH